ncbi:hypothetical protein SAMN02982996_01179 [Lonsdalea quercina]|uniref:Uncharacterized protein n=1 Tax=Lonsdalea quercina TaxID=71657 RepID=A0A1H3ZGH4_9GAMM|nr:hypothetical protein SAMN02982996_01179 [Lonsdalea quercina]
MNTLSKIKYQIIFISEEKKVWKTVKDYGSITAQAFFLLSDYMWCHALQ